MDALRVDVYERDNGQCVNCGKPVIFDAPHEWPNSFHLAHRKGKRMHGDSAENTQTECGQCHREFHNFGPSRTKPCPPKIASNILYSACDAE